MSLVDRYPRVLVNGVSHPNRNFLNAMIKIQLFISSLFAKRIPLRHVMAAGIN